MRSHGTPTSTASVGLVDVDEELQTHIEKALSAEAVLSKSVSLEDATESLIRQMPNVALVSIENDSSSVVAFAKEIQRELPDLTLIALARSRDPDVILTAMRVGFSEFIVLPEDAEQLRTAVSQSAQQRAADGGSAMVVAVLGAKGGVGSTMIAAHLAAELAGIHRVLCMDLDFGKGDLAPLMDTKPTESIADLLPRASSVDERMLSGHTIVHGSKVHLLCQPDDIERIESVQAEDVFNIINAAAQGFQYIVIDAGSKVSQANEFALRVADHVLLVTTPDVISVRDTHRTFKSLLTRGIDRQQVHVVINRMPKKPFLTAETIESNLGLKVVGILPDDPQRVEQAVNEGKLLRELFPRSEIVVELGRLVGILSDEADLSEVDASAASQQKGGILSRFFSK